MGKEVFHLPLTQKQENAARKKIFDVIEPALKEAFGDLLTTAKNKRVIPFAEDDIECFVNIAVSVVRGPRDSEIPYDPYTEEKEYLAKLAEDEAKKAKKAAADKEKADRVEAAAKKRREAAEHKTNDE